ncbi:hypothetical protein [Streptosporangium roseum]|uniref:hypothetical protein n=1 Tax=Streptosporangium roseum TaxID=2001 RepID=UPI0004CD83FB|nr:hypothetical protein [Streptosporangium roseum]
MEGWPAVGSSRPPRAWQGLALVTAHLFGLQPSGYELESADGAPAVGLAAGSAHAAPSEYANGANGSVGIPCDRSGAFVPVKSADPGNGRRVKPHSGAVSGRRGRAGIPESTEKEDRV